MLFPACHAGGREFESRPSRHFKIRKFCDLRIFLSHRARFKYMIIRAFYACVKFILYCARFVFLNRKVPPLWSFLPVGKGFFNLIGRPISQKFGSDKLFGCLPWETLQYGRIHNCLKGISRILKCSISDGIAKTMIFPCLANSENNAAFSESHIL